jgi:hypothetical protein
MEARGGLRRQARAPRRPVEIDHGPSVGARVAYLRINDGVTLELFQRPGA